MRVGKHIVVQSLDDGLGAALDHVVGAPFVFLSDLKIELATSHFFGRDRFVVGNHTELRITARKRESSPKYKARGGKVNRFRPPRVAPVVRRLHVERDNWERRFLTDRTF